MMNALHVIPGIIATLLLSRLPVACVHLDSTACLVRIQVRLPMLILVQTSHRMCALLGIIALLAPYYLLTVLKVPSMTRKEAILALIVRVVPQGIIVKGLVTRIQPVSVVLVIIAQVVRRSQHSIRLVPGTTLWLQQPRRKHVLLARISPMWVNRIVTIALLGHFALILA